MSTRPVRTRKPPNRLTTRAPKANKNTQVVVENNKPEANKNTQVATKARKQDQTKKTKPIKKIDIMKNIENKKFMKLASLYQIMEDTQIQRNIEGGGYRGELLSLINKQQEAIEKSTIKIEQKKFNFKSDDIKLDFLVLLWLDMSHDATVVKDWTTHKPPKPIYYTFREFLKLKISNVLVPNTPKIKITKFISKLGETGAIDYNTNNSNIVDITTNPGFEVKLKMNFENLFDLKDILEATSSESIGKYLKDKNNPIYISVDQESDKQSPISLLIIKSKYDNKRNNGTKKSLYGFKSLVTLANIIDPGAIKGKKGSLLRDVSQLFERPPRVFSKFVDIKKFDLDGKIIEIIPSSTDYGKYDLKIGTEFVKGGKTKKTAQEENDKLLKISKFCGDFLQILSVAAAQKTINCTVGTGDAMMATMYLFIQKHVLGEPNPRIVFDKSYLSGRSNIIICGFSNQIINKYVKNKSISPSNKTGVTRPASGRTNIKGANKSVSKPLNTQNQKPTGSVKQRTPQNKPQGAKRKRTPNVNVNVPVAKKMKKTTPARKAAPSRNNTAGMNRPNSNVSQRKRLRSTTGSVGSRVKQIKISASNRSSAAKTNRSPNSVTQSRSGNGKVESITQTKSPESVTRTTSARPATSNSARSNQTRG
jgi:hypothetical protein